MKDFTEMDFDKIYFAAADLEMKQGKDTDSEKQICDKNIRPRQIFGRDRYMRNTNIWGNKYAGRERQIFVHE